MNPKTRIVQVALSSPLRRLFDYILPDCTNEVTSNETMIGRRVAVPFGHQKSIVGIIISERPSQSPTNKLRKIHQILDREAVLNSDLLKLCLWCADYYHYPLGDVCLMALPAVLRKPDPMPKAVNHGWQLTTLGHSTGIESLKRAEKQKTAFSLIKNLNLLKALDLKQHNISSTTLKALADKQLIEKVDVKDSPLNKGVLSETLSEVPLTLNNEQKNILDQLSYDKFHTTLIDGITGSGKTEVYLQAIEPVLKQGGQILVLVPEIGLTPQTVSRFEKRFTQQVASLHSGLTNKQRFAVWKDAQRGNISILIGTRSSIFTPLPHLGLIIIDEEHDLSYKQQEGVRYSGRDMAIVRAQQKNIPLILGSATPSLESLHNALSQRYHYRTLRTRAQQQTLPVFRCLDTQENTIAEKSLSAIETALENRQQVMVFINRRGYAPTLMCQDCQWLSQCNHCDSRMTLHRHSGQQNLHCHSCDTKTKVPSQCPKCHSHRLQALGSGTQRSEEVLEEHFKSTPILRIDRDSISRKGQLETTLNTINEGKPCILVGTQMLAKGHHFPNLGLGIILGLDQAFFSSDFRGAERMGQLLTQVTGRVGRENYQGEVIIQTQFADHPLLKLLINDSYEALAKLLLQEREFTQMPPYSHLALIRCHAQQPQLAENFLRQARYIAQKIKPPSPQLQYLGPFPATMEKRNNRYHYLLQIKAANRKERQQLLSKLCEKLEQTKIPNGLHWLIDVDPQEF